MHINRNVWNHDKHKIRITHLATHFHEARRLDRQYHLARRLHVWIYTRMRDHSTIRKRYNQPDTYHSIIAANQPYHKHKTQNSTFFFLFCYFCCRPVLVMQNFPLRPPLVRPHTHSHLLQSISRLAPKGYHHQAPILYSLERSIESFRHGVRPR